MTEIERLGMTQSQLEDAETVIERGRETFIEVGQALEAIRVGKGYRLNGHATFADYCRARWGFGYDWAYKQIEAARVAENLDTYQGLSVSKAAELAPLAPEQQREVAATVNFQTATVREVREEVRRIQPTQVRAVVENGERRMERVPEQAEADAQRSIFETVAAVVPGAQERIARASLKSHFTRASYDLRRDLLALNPDAVYAALDRDDMLNLRMLLSDLESWISRMRAADAQPVRAVK